MKNLHKHEYLEFWASYWNISAAQLASVISKIGSSSFLKIQTYMEEKLSRN